MFFFRGKCNVSKCLPRVRSYPHSAAIASSVCTNRAKGSSPGDSPCQSTTGYQQWKPGGIGWERCAAAQCGTELSTGCGGSAVPAEHGPRKTCSLLPPPSAGSAYAPVLKHKPKPWPKHGCHWESVSELLHPAHCPHCATAALQQSSGASAPPDTSESSIPSGEGVLLKDLESLVLQTQRRGKVYIQTCRTLKHHFDFCSWATGTVRKSLHPLGQQE